MALAKVFSTPYIIAGLGNPGREYAGSRHNVGFQCVELLARRHHILLNDRRSKVVLGQGVIHKRPVVIAKPRTYVNASGAAIRYLATRFGTGPEMLLVITDDMDLPLGKLRLRASGGSGGHNGLSSIIDEIGSEAFSRLRIGIGRPVGGAVEHVLGPFTRSEEVQMASRTDQAADAVESWLEDGVEAAMNRFN